LEEADWILFAQQDLNPVKGPNSDAVKLFLNHSLSASYDARLVVLAFNAPYYLDTTEISKLSLYLGAYSKVSPFVESTVRVLFGERLPQGTLPVDVVGINYDLQHQLAPDPEQTIPLRLPAYSSRPARSWTATATVCATARPSPFTPRLPTGGMCPLSRPLPSAAWPKPPLPWTVRGRSAFAPRAANRSVRRRWPSW
jgi:beta-N-acetylhexosaminidase